MADSFIPLDGLSFDAPQPAPVQQASANASPMAPPAVAPSQGALDPGFIPLDAAVAGHPQVGPSDSALADLPTRLASAATGGLGNIAALPRDITQGIDWLGNKVGLNIGADQALASIPRPFGPTSAPLFPDAQAARERAFAATGATEYVPSTLSGRMLQAGLEGAVPAVINPGSIIPTIAGGAVGEGAAELLPDHPIVARMLGFLAGAQGANTVLNGATRVAGATLSAAPGPVGALGNRIAPTSDLYQAYQRQGVPTTLSGDVTQNPSLQLAQSIAAKMPGGSEAIRHAGEEVANAWQDAAERSATQLGPAATMQEAGQGLQTAANQWKQDFQANSAAKWNAFQQAVPTNTPIPVNAFQQALTDVNQNFGGATNLASALQPGLASKLQTALSADISPQGTLPWQSVQATRSALGEMLQGQPIADAPQAAIKRLYGGLSNDMRDGANNASPQAARLFNEANAYTAFGHNLIDDHVGPILNATNPEQAAQFALGQAKQGGSRLAALNFAMPGSPEGLGAAVLRKAASNSPDGSPTPGGLPTALKNISPEAQTQLFGAQQPNVNDLMDIALAARRTMQTSGNNSNSAAHASAGLGRIMTAMEFAKEGKEMGGPMGAAGGAALGLMAPNVVGGAARAFGANPLLSYIYSTQAAPFSAPSMFSPNALATLGQPDRRTLPGALAGSPRPSAP